MATDVERLIVRLEATQRQFERQLQGASRTADRRARQIETRFAQMNRKLTAQFTALGRTFVGAFAGGIFAGGAAGLVGGVNNLVKEMSRLAVTAERVGYSAEDLQRLRYAFEQIGVSANQTDTAMQRFARRIGEASAGTGVLHSVLEANNVQLRNQDGSMRRQIDLLRDYADLIKNAGSEQERLVLANRAFDVEGSVLVGVLKGGREAIDQLMASADEAGGVIDEQLVRRAEELDKKWTDAWRNFEVNGKSAVISVIAYLDRLSEKLSGIGNSSIFRWMSDQLGGGGVFVPGEGVYRPGDDMSPSALVQQAFQQEMVQADAKLVEALKARYGAAAEQGRKTIIPGGSSGGSSSRNAAAEAALREQEAVLNLIDALSHELSLIGESDLEKAKANALRQAGAAATEEQRAQIEALVTAIHQETEALKEREEAQRAQAQAINNLFDMGADALISIAEGSERAEEAIKRLAIQLAFAAAQAALLGTGPLAGLLGGGGGGSFVPTPGAGMFARGAAFSRGKVIPFARGGIVDKPTVFPMARGMGLMGEAGPEAVLPLRRGPGGRLGVEAAGGQHVHVTVGIAADSNGNLTPFVERVSQRTMQAGLAHYDRNVFPARFAQVAGDPRRRY